MINSGSYGAERDGDFWSDLMKSRGDSASWYTSSPFTISSRCDILLPNGNHYYLDIQSLGPAPVLYTGIEDFKFFYYGSLCLKIFVNTATSVGVYTSYLGFGRNSLGLGDYIVDQRNIAVGIVDLDLGKSREFYYDQVGFKVLRFALSGVGNSIYINYNFTGYRIAW